MRITLKACLRSLVAALALSGTTATAIAQQAYYIHADHLNTPRLIENQSQQVVWRWDNDDPFGANMANANPGGLGTFTFNLRFPGQYFDQETNYHYNYFRDYSPDTGRYVQSDPIGLDGGTNTFGYVFGNPITHIDPTGEVTPAVAAAVLAGIFYGGMRLWNQAYQVQSAAQSLASSTRVLVSAQSACVSYPQGGACSSLPYLQQVVLQCAVGSVLAGIEVPGTLSNPALPNISSVPLPTSSLTDKSAVAPRYPIFPNADTSGAYTPGYNRSNRNNPK